MDVDRDARHQPFVFQRLAPAQDDVADDGIVALEEAEPVRRP